MSLAVNVLGVDFVNPLMNAAGVQCMTAIELDNLAASQSGAMITKSCTLESREGNPSPRYQAAPLGSINSMGLPNMGYAFYDQYVSELLRKTATNTTPKKPIFFSMSGMSLEDNIKMASALYESHGKSGGVILELNLSCPNVPGKAQIGYDMADMDAYLEGVSSVYKAPFGVKMPPYFDIAHFDSAASVLNKFPNVSFVTCVNSVGNGLIIDTEAESVVIAPKGGFGGIGGKYILPTALANVHAFFKRCPEKVVLGCGGVTSGDEAFMHILAGASLVQIGTQLYEEGFPVFERIQVELLQIMKSKGYNSIDDFRGKLKALNPSQ